VLGIFVVGISVGDDVGSVDGILLGKYVVGEAEGSMVVGTVVGENDGIVVGL